MSGRPVSDYLALHLTERHRMTTRIDRRFEKLKAEDRPALVTYFMGGDPDYETSLSIMKALPKAGADVIELGMPFSDPMADGPAIQAAGLRALKGGQTLKKTLAMAAEFRRGDNETPIVLMGYYNPIYIYGVDRFLADAIDAGIDGLIVVDLPPEMDEELCIPALKAGINFIRLATPTTDDRRLPKVLQNTSGFVYYVSMTGITGSALPDTTKVAAAVKRIKGHTEPAGLRRLRRQDRRAGQGDRRFGRRRRRRHGDRQRGGQCRSAPTARRPPIRPRRWRRWSAGLPPACAPRALLPPDRHPMSDPATLFRPTRIEAMNWITNYVRPKINSMLGRREMPENLWIKDPETGEMVFHKDLEENQHVIPSFRPSHADLRQGAAEILLRRRQIRGHRKPQGGGRSAEIPRREALCRPAARRQDQDRTGGCDPDRARRRSRTCRSSPSCRISPSWAARSAWRRATRSSRPST